MEYTFTNFDIDNPGRFLLACKQTQTDELTDATDHCMPTPRLPPACMGNK